MMCIQTTIINAISNHAFMVRNHEKIGPKGRFKVLQYLTTKTKQKSFWDQKIPDLFKVENLRANNKLMPSETQCNMLKDMPTEMKTFKKTIFWYNMFYPYIYTFFSTFYVRHRKNAIEDQKKRCNLLIDKMMEQKKKHLITFDGHGRFILTFLNCLKTRGEKFSDWDFTVVELDKDVHHWHELFFPSSFKCVKMNMFEFMKKEKLDDKFIYLNFCSIPANYKQKWADLLENKKFRQKNVAISFETRSRCTGYLTKLGKLTGKGLVNKIVNNGGSSICQRKTFVTYLV